MGHNIINGINYYSQIFSRWNNVFYAPVHEQGNFDGNANTDSRGLFTGVRVSPTRVDNYKNGTLHHTGVNAIASSAINNNIYICCSNDAGTAAKFSARNIAMAFISSGSINQLNFYNRFQTFATSIGFNV